jgi:hypothetical protein
MEFTANDPQVPAPQTRPPPNQASVNLRTNVYNIAHLRANPLLAARITTFVNVGYRNKAVYAPAYWTDDGTDRFQTPDAIYDAIGPNGLFAVVYNEKPVDDELVACASITSWIGDLGGEETGKDDGGWEIKAVVTKVGWNKMGLAGRCIQMLTEETIKLEREALENKGERTLKIWIQAVESVNGEYWRRRGWKFVRAYEMPVGLWGSRFGFTLIVLLKEVDLQNGEVVQDTLRKKTVPLGGW